jgi:hypothetical protein
MDGRERGEFERIERVTFVMSDGTTRKTVFNAMSARTLYVIVNDVRFVPSRDVDWDDRCDTD